MSNTGHPFLLWIALAIFPSTAPAISPDSSYIAVTIHRDGQSFVVDVDFVIESTPQEVWDVLTDYDHMAQFVSNVAMSRIVRREQEKLEVAQTSRLNFGLFELKVDNVREIEFVPLQEIRSTLIRGDLKASAFTTRISAEGGDTRVTNHGRFTPDRWIPPLIGTAILEAETRKQFAEFRTEILRRNNRVATNPR